MSDNLKEREEAKRERCWDPLQRWKILQETIAWVDAQQDVPRNSPQGALQKQNRLLKQLHSDL